MTKRPPARCLKPRERYVTSRWMHGRHFLACWSRHDSHDAVFAGLFEVPINMRRCVGSSSWAFSPSALRCWRSLRWLLFVGFLSVGSSLLALSASAPLRGLSLRPLLFMGFLSVGSSSWAFSLSAPLRGLSLCGLLFVGFVFVGSSSWAFSPWDPLRGPFSLGSSSWAFSLCAPPRVLPLRRLFVGFLFVGFLFCSAAFVWASTASHGLPLLRVSFCCSMWASVA